MSHAMVLRWTDAHKSGKMAAIGRVHEISYFETSPEMFPARFYEYCGRSRVSESIRKHSSQRDIATEFTSYVGHLPDDNAAPDADLTFSPPSVLRYLSGASSRTQVDEGEG